MPTDHQTLTRYVTLYNQHIPQRALLHLGPIDCLKTWYHERPELFHKPPYNLTGLLTASVIHKGACAPLMNLQDNTTPIACARVNANIWTFFCLIIAGR